MLSFFALQARQTLSVLRQRKDEEVNHNSQQHSGHERGQRSATAELLRIKDHLIDVEKNVRSITPGGGGGAGGEQASKPAVSPLFVVHPLFMFDCLFVFSQNASLQTERSLLKDQLKQLENQNTSLNNQMLGLQRHTSTLQEQNTALHTQTAKQQVGARRSHSP